MIQITQETKDGWCIVTLTGRADSATADEVEAGLRTAIESNKQVAVNLAALDYISSAGLRAVIQAGRAAETAGVKLAFCAPMPNVRRIFDMSGLHQILVIQGELPC